MLLKSDSFYFLVLACAIIAPAASAPNYHHYCPQCEEEVWEEVPCEEVATTSRPTTTTTARPKPPTYAPTTQRPHTTARSPVKKTTTTKPRTAHHTTPTPPVTTTAATTYNNCYCECKGGCKEFCRKVTVNGAAQAAQKQITQVTKTTHRVPNGQLNSEHVHLLRFVPDSQTSYTPVQPSTQHSIPSAIYPINPNNELVNPYLHRNLAYKVQPAMPPPSGPSLQPQPVAIAYPQSAPNLYEDSQVTNIYPDTLLESSYSVDELTRLLQMENLNKAAANSYTQSINGPSYAVHDSLPQTPLSTAPIYQPLSLSLGFPLPADASKYENNSSESQYKELRLDVRSQSYASPLLPASESQYANYVHKIDLSEPQLYAVASPSLPAHQAGYDQHSSATLSCHNIYDDPSTEYMNSISYGSEYGSPTSSYAPQTGLYAPSY
ncbi:sialidase [Bactrocera neohumeralis]|uniref:sialidase n=1 Tax=Bactrocera neohumeralis TaxID=98809 RepID=UPI002166B33C|nr:sialidase [Bactrocera neohumeralis]